MAQMELPPGFRVELVAAEPLVQDPISFAFDERERLWVLEWPSYNWELRPDLPGLDEQAPPSSRVVVLEDTDGDRRMDRRTVFAEVDWPRGIQPIGGGVLVFALPDVVFLRDTDGDGKADDRQVVYGELPIPANPHAAPSSPLWTIDNWIYALQTDTRLRHVGGQWQLARAGRLGGQWGLSQDNEGRLFFGYNGDHLRGSLVPVHYAVRNPSYAGRAGIDVRVGQDQNVWPHGLTASVNRRAQLRDEGRLQVFTANAGPSVYRGDHFPQEFHGNVFVAEAAGRLIRRVVLTEKNGTVTGGNAYHEREFLFSREERFRPVFTAGGPDGALYIADMHRGIIEGHIFVTTFLRNQAVERKLHQPFHGSGRIYRIVHEGRPLSTAPVVRPDDTGAWVPHLGHPNGFWRDAAQRVIVSAGGTSFAPALKELSISATDSVTRLHALWTLEGLQAVDEDILRGLLKDRAPPVRRAALRAAEPLMQVPRMVEAVLPLMEDPEIGVRRQLLFSLGTSRLPQAERAILSMLERDAGEPFMVDAALSGFAGRELAILDGILDRREWEVERPGRRELVAALATAITNANMPEGLDRCLRRAVDGKEALWRRLAILNGIAASERRDEASPPPGLALLDKVQEPELRDAVTKVQARFRPPREQPGQAGTTEGVKSGTAALIEEGRKAYAICAGCHQADGRGLAALAPSLHGTERVTGPPEILIDIALNGRDVDPAYPSMPPLVGMPDESLAAILTYVRQAWGNNASSVSPEQVRTRRGAR